MGSEITSTNNKDNALVNTEEGWSITLDISVIWRSVLLFVATLVSHWQAIGGGFIWDDDAHVTRIDLRSLEGLWNIWFKLGATQQYYPLLHSIFWFEHAVWGDAANCYHIANILFHTLAVFLLVAVLRRLEIPGAWVAGFVFALHPVHVESVAWITEQKNTVSAVFYFLAAYRYIGYDQSRKSKDYWYAFAFFVLALLSKTVTATLPAALLVIFWWKRGKLSWKQDVYPLVPFFILGAIGGIFTAWVERVYIGAHGSDFLLTPLMRCLLAGHVIW
jgi:protein O-mannosyl-transferase